MDHLVKKIVVVAERARNASGKAMEANILRDYDRLEEELETARKHHQKCKALLRQVEAMPPNPVAERICSKAKQMLVDIELAIALAEDI